MSNYGSIARTVLRICACVSLLWCNVSCERVSEKAVVFDYTEAAIERLSICDSGQLVVKGRHELSGVHYYSNGIIVRNMAELIIKAGSTIILGGSDGWIRNDGVLICNGADSSTVRIYACGGIVGNGKSIITHTQIEFGGIALLSDPPIWGWGVPDYMLGNSRSKEIIPGHYYIYQSSVYCCKASLLVWDYYPGTEVGRLGLVRCETASLLDSVIDYKVCDRSTRQWCKMAYNHSIRSSAGETQPFIVARDLRVTYTEISGVGFALASGCGVLANCDIKRVASGKVMYQIVNSATVTCVRCRFSGCRIAIYQGQYVECCFVDCDIENAVTVRALIPRSASFESCCFIECNLYNTHVEGWFDEAMLSFTRYGYVSDWSTDREAEYVPLSRLTNIGIEDTFMVIKPVGAPSFSKCIFEECGFSGVGGLMRASVCFFSACYLRTSEPLVVIGVCLFGNKDKPSLHPMYNIAYENPLLSEYRLYSAKHWAWMDEGETILALSSLLYRASCVARPAPTGTRP